MVPIIRLLKDTYNWTTGVKCLCVCSGGGGAEVYFYYRDPNPILPELNVISMAWHMVLRK